MTINYYASIFIPKLEQMDRPSAEHAAGKRRHTVAKRENDLRKYSRSELLEILVEQGRRIETLERELDCACRALAELQPAAGSGAARNTAFGSLPEDVGDTARKNARTLLFDVVALMRTLERTEDSCEEAKDEAPQP